MSANKTQPTDQDVGAFLAALDDPQQRMDSLRIAEMMRTITGKAPRMWGTSMIGFGKYHYRYASGREGYSFLTGFSPRKQNLTIYLAYGFEQHADLLQRLGKHKIGKACLYIKRLADVDQEVLRALIAHSVEAMARMNTVIED